MKTLLTPHLTPAQTQIRFLTVKSRGKSAIHPSFFLSSNIMVSGRWIRGSKKSKRSAHGEIKVPNVARSRTSMVKGAWRIIHHPATSSRGLRLYRASSSRQ
ncbi:MAG: hypothetical protein Q8Q07_04635 [Dehalococcoidales bacterium]|nr:hypothetical protein [Dehalococcoidales bacterium]